MKKTILLFMVILIIPSVMAVYGGENWTYHFDYCDELRVNVTAAHIIDDGEYTILSDCIENKTNYWICNCTDDFDFKISFNLTAVNNYIFKFNYDYSVFEEEVKSNGGGGGRTGSYYSSSWLCGSWGDCINNTQIQKCYKGKVEMINERHCVSEVEDVAVNDSELPETINETTTEEIVDEVVLQEEDEAFPTVIIIFYVIGFIILGIIIYYLVKQ